MRKDTGVGLETNFQPVVKWHLMTTENETILMVSTDVVFSIQGCFFGDVWGTKTNLLCKNHMHNYMLQHR